MSIDLATLQLLKHRKRYEALSRAVPKRALDARTQILLADFGRFFKEFPEASRIDRGAFGLFFKMIHPKLGDDDLAVYDHLFAQIEEDPAPGIEQGLMRRLQEAATAYDTALMLEKYQAGEEVDVRAGLVAFLSEYDEMVERKIKSPQVLDPIEELLKAEENDEGLHWRLPCLNRSIKGIVGGDLIVVAGRPDKGKCLHPDTPVLLASGATVAAKEVQPGDVLAGPFMNNRVLGVTTGRAEMFRVTYPWGESYVVNEDHVLSVNVRGAVVNLPVKDFLSRSASWQERAKGWKSGVEFPLRVLPMDPYLLGAWLGDGTTDKPQITSADDEVVAEFVTAYGEPTRVWNGITHDFWKSDMLPELRAAGVYGNKHIPSEYLRSSSAQRLELLAGIIDSGGHAGDVYEVVTKSDSLKDGYVWLARSLGFHAVACRTFKRATNSEHTGDWYWRVRIGAEAFGVVPVRLGRKRGNTKTRKRNGLHFGITVTPEGVGEYAGFGLDGDHLFLLGDFTVTHNTTFLTDNLTHMAPQVDKLYPGENRSILWFNNEGPGKRIVTRCFQSALNATIEDLVRLSHQPADHEFAQYKTMVRQKYAEALGGRPGVLRVFDIHDFWNHEVEDIIALYNPALLVFDMVDNIKFGGAVNNNGQRTDQVLEAMYQWARVRGVKHDCGVIATSQISAEGDGMPYPTLPMLKDSRTGKQGAADVILTIGTVNDDALANSRYMGTTKNKKARTGAPSSPRTEVIFRGDRGRYEEAPK